MSRKHLGQPRMVTTYFQITNNVPVRLDLDRKRVMILCHSADGKSLGIDADYQTIDKIHDEVHRQREIP